MTDNDFPVRKGDVIDVLFGGIDDCSCGGDRGVEHLNLEVGKWGSVGVRECGRGVRNLEFGIWKWGGEKGGIWKWGRGRGLADVCPFD